METGALDGCGQLLRGDCTWVVHDVGRFDSRLTQARTIPRSRSSARWMLSAPPPPGRPASPRPTPARAVAARTGCGSPRTVLLAPCREQPGFFALRCEHHELLRSNSRRLAMGTSGLAGDGRSGCARVTGSTGLLSELEEARVPLEMQAQGCASRRTGEGR